MADCTLLCSVRAVMDADVGFPIGFTRIEGCQVCGPHTIVRHVTAVIARPVGPLAA